MFGRVLGRIMYARGIPADEERAVELAEKSGLDSDVFRARLAGSPDANLGDLSRLAGELNLSTQEMGVLALAYVYEEERELENPVGQDPERIPHPEEVLDNQEDLTPDQRLEPLRCQAGRKTDNPCPRGATTWMYPEDRNHPVCDEHARANELWLESSDWGVAEEVTRDWLRVARAWHFEELERLALNAHEDAKVGFLKADARAELAQEVADAPRKGRKERIADLTPEQDAESQRLISRADALVNARTALEDHATGKMPEEVLRRILGGLVEEGERATEEAHRYHEEIGIRPE